MFFFYLSQVIGVLVVRFSLSCVSQTLHPAALVRGGWCKSPRSLKAGWGRLGFFGSK